MVEIPDNESPDTSVSEYCATCPKIYAALYYERHSQHSNFSDEDHAFKYTANTFMTKVVENSYIGYDFKFEYTSADVLIKQKFNDEASLAAAWDAINNRAVAGEMKVACVAIFSHHEGAAQSYIAGWNPTPATDDANDPYDSRNMSGAEVGALQKLPWIEGKGLMFLMNCNGDEGRGSVASAFHSGQGAKVYYSKAYSYFSNSHTEYNRSYRLATGTASTSNVGDLYLLAFARGSHNEDDPDVTNHGSGLRVAEGVYG